MGIVKRFFVLIPALAALAAAGLFLLLLTGFLSVATAETWLAAMAGKTEIIAVLAAVFCWSLVVLVGCFIGVSTGERAKEVVVVNGKIGAVKIDADVLAGLVENLAGTVEGVRSAAAKVHTGKDTKIILSVGMGLDRNAAAVGDAVRQKVTADLAAVAGIENVALDIRVAEFAAGAKAGKRVV